MKARDVKVGDTLTDPPFCGVKVTTSRLAGSYWLIVDDSGRSLYFQLSDEFPGGVERPEPLYAVMKRKADILRLAQLRFGHHPAWPAEYKVAVEQGWMEAE